ncbi:YlzJ-like family protein [Paenibacillus tarimensis]
MTLYTIIPIERVFESPQEERNMGVEIMYNGVHLQIEPVAPGMGKVIRILDGSLNDYLRPELAPGCVLMYGQGAINYDRNNYFINNRSN